jgi:phosphomethylpyrimidine synthase
VARRRPGARDRDDEMARARFAFDWNRQFELSLDPEAAREKRRETLPDDDHASADYCSMCGPKFCSMRTTRRLSEAERAACAEAQGLGSSPGPLQNRP